MSSSSSDAILRWLSSCFGVKLPSPSSVTDGVEMANILHAVDSQFFSEQWKSKIKTDVPSDNKRLRSSNVKKVLSGVLEYYSDLLSLQLLDFPMPDPARVVDGSAEDVYRLLQLVMGCAVNCDNKSVYIEAIMSMDEEDQRLIMQSIQELMDLQTAQAEPSLPAALSPSDVKKMMEELADLKKEREELAQRLHDTEQLVNTVKNEKASVASELEQLQAQMGSAGSSYSRGASDSGIPNQELRKMSKQVESTQEELYKMETQRDELQVKVEMQEKQLEDAMAKESELQKLADQALKFKDELDVLRETADKVSKYEATIESYKKKLEDLGDLRRQVKMLEEKNTDYMQINMELEENVKKTGNWRPQIDAYKKQIAELHARLDSETKKSDRLEFDTKKMLEKVEALSEERDRLQNEKDDFKTKNDELADEVKFLQATGAGGAGGARHAGGGAAGLEGLETIPPSVKERLLRLEHENKKLLRAAGTAQNADLLQTMIDDLKERETQLQATNRSANQKIMELESKLEEASSSSGTGNSVPRVPGSREELELKLAEASKKITHLEDTMQKKDFDMQVMEERYKKYIEKAKSVIKTLDPKTAAAAAAGTAAGSALAGGQAEVGQLRTQLNEKEQRIETMEHETEKARVVREMEERLMSSAFYNLSMHMHRQAVEARLSSATGGQSFLARQRQHQANGRQPNAAAQSGGGNRAAAVAGAGGYNSSEFVDY